MVVHTVNNARMDSMVIPILDMAARPVRVQRRIATLHADAMSGMEKSAAFASPAIQDDCVNVAARVSSAIRCSIQIALAKPVIATQMASGKRAVTQRRVSASAAKVSRVLSATSVWRKGIIWLRTDAEVSGAL